jgi:hypothetical protein
VKPSSCRTSSAAPCEISSSTTLREGEGGMAQTAQDEEKQGQKGGGG